MTAPVDFDKLSLDFALQLAADPQTRFLKTLGPESRAEAEEILRDERELLSAMTNAFTASDRREAAHYAAIVERNFARVVERRRFLRAEIVRFAMRDCPPITVRVSR